MRDELDQMLNEAIKSYAAVEPPPELPARILRQAQLEPAPQRNRWRLALAFALPLAATLTLVFLFAGQMNLPKPPESIASQPPTPTTPKPQPPETLAAATSKPAPVPIQRHAHTARKPRSWVRPLPAPYSKEELALLNFVQQHPKEAAEIAKTQKRPLKPLSDEPITISHLEITPLTIASLDQEK